MEQLWPKTKSHMALRSCCSEGSISSKYRPVVAKYRHDASINRHDFKVVVNEDVSQLQVQLLW